MQDLISNECVLLFFWDLFECLHVSARKEDENGPGKIRDEAKWRFPYLSQLRITWYRYLMIKNVEENDSSTLLDVNFLYPLFLGESLNLTNHPNQNSIVSPVAIIRPSWRADGLVCLSYCDPLGMHITHNTNIFKTFDVDM